MKLSVLVLVSACAISVVAPALAAPPDQPVSCPLVDAGDVSATVGSPVTLWPFGVVDDGPQVQCVFQGDNDLLVIVARWSNFFGADEGGPFTSDQLERVRRQVNGEVDLTPADGVGDAAVWATFRDRGAAPDALGRLFVKRGRDLFTGGLTEGPDAVARASALTQVLIAR